MASANVLPVARAGSRASIRNGSRPLVDFFPEASGGLPGLGDAVHAGRAYTLPLLFVAVDPRRLTGSSHLQIEPASIRMFTLCSHEPGKLAFPVVLDALN